MFDLLLLQKSFPPLWMIPMPRRQVRPRNDELLQWLGRGCKSQVQGSNAPAICNCEYISVQQLRFMLCNFSGRYNQWLVLLPINGSGSMF